LALDHLDRQLRRVAEAAERPDLPDPAWSRLATTIQEEVQGLDETAANQLRAQMLIPPERYREELEAFQSWMEFAQANRHEPVIVRAQIMTELYVSLVWLRDSMFRPLMAAVPPDSVTAITARFLGSGRRRLFRNAIAHGRWCYLPTYQGLEFWAEPTRGARHQRFEISAADLDTWQLLSRGSAIAALLGLTEQH
jgi:hypothetical protein